MIYVYPPATIDPNIMPTKVGQVWVNTATGHVWVSNGTASSANWSDTSASTPPITVSAADKVLGRFSSGSGPVEEIACTAAARSVLGDATVAAMVDTLFGAASSGTGGAARVNGPTFTAPTLGVASATSLNLGSSVFSQLSSNHVSVANGANAQSFSVYNVAGTDYERGVFDWQTTADTLTIGTQKGGAGSNRGINFTVGGVTALSISSTFVTSVVSSLTVGASVGFQAGANGYIYSQSDGVITLYTSAFNSFDRLQYGGTTSSFPSIKRRTTALEARLADDSAITTLVGAMVLKAGAISDTDFTNPVNGCHGYDTTNNKHYVRNGGVWKSSAAYT